MIKVTPVNDDDLLISLEGSSVAPQPATDLVLLWDECAKGEPLQTRYAAFRRKLSDSLGQSITSATAYLVLEAAVGAITSLKKTHIA